MTPNEKPPLSDWSAARGDRWYSQLSGMEPTLVSVDEPLIRALELEVPSRIAEVGCGGGATTLAILRRAPTGSVVHGFDISPTLIDHASRRVPPGEHAVAFEVADMSTAAPREPYDRLVSRFGVMFFDDAPAAFTNLARWLKPGGRFALAVWGALSDNPWFISIRDLVARFVDVPQPDPTAPGAFRYGETAGFFAVLERAGFAKLEVSDWHGSLPIGGGLAPAEAARFALAAFSSFGELLAKAGGSTYDEAHRSLTAFYRNHQQDGIVRMDACVHLVTGAKP
jgi:SAM-dependent methyltransferase